MSNRPELESALDVRSYERVVVIASPESTHEYPEGWDKPARLSELRVDGDCVVVVDRVEIQRKTLSQIGESMPRLVAFAVVDVPHEKQVRRMLNAMYPWNEVWKVYTTFGTLLITKDVRGPSYDRSHVVDMREGATA